MVFVHTSGMLALLGTAEYLAVQGRIGPDSLVIYLLLDPSQAQLKRLDSLQLER